MVAEMAGGRAAFLHIGQAKLDRYGEDVLTFAQPWHRGAADVLHVDGSVVALTVVVAYDISENGRLRRVYRR